MKYDSEIKRIVFLVIAALFVWTVIILRIVQIQLTERGKYVEIAKDQYMHEMTLTSYRGNIYDRHANLLAINKPAFSVGVDVKKVSDPNYAASLFAEIFGGTRNYYLRHLSNGSHFVWLKRGIEDDVSAKLENSKVGGLRIFRENKRFYPQNRLAAQLIGFTDIDLKGLSGVELAMEESLRGSPGKVIYQKDALGKTFTDVSYPVCEPESGKDIMLTIDNSYQLFAEEELRYSVNQYNAEGGIVLITDPYTGEILAMAVMPTFDPNSPGNFPPDTWRNRIITDSYEPGSTFKPFFMSAVIDEDIKKPDEVIFCENGKYKIYEREIEDITGYGWLTLHKIIEKSSNIGMAKLAQQVNRDIIYQYARDFGFGVKTGIDLNGEVAGELKNTIDWTRNTPIAMSRGYEVSATPLQLAMAYGAIANGGYLLKPKIFIQNLEEERKKTRLEKGKVIRRVISTNTSQTIKSMLKSVVESGTAQRAAIPGLHVAGKTGTARKYDSKKQAYSTEEFLASFIGFYPVDEPRIVICVMIDKPQNEYLGGVVAATTFKRILQKIVRTMEIDAESFVELKQPVPQPANMPDGNIIVPNLISKKAEIGIQILNEMDLDVVCKNNGELIQAQEPTPGTKVAPHSVVSLKLKEVKENNKEYTHVPKVLGLPVRDALNKLSLENLNVVIQGSGCVFRQIPGAGEKIRVGARCVIQCRPNVDLSDFRSW